MGYHLEFNFLLVVARDQLDLTSIHVGKLYTIQKDAERLYPLNIPIEICDSEYQYYGKIAVRKLSLEAGKTMLEIEVLKIFDQNEADIYTKNFIKSS